MSKRRKMIVTLLICRPFFFFFFPGSLRAHVVQASHEIGTYKFQELSGKVSSVLPAIVGATESSIKLVSLCMLVVEADIKVLLIRSS